MLQALTAEALRRGMESRARWTGRPPIDVQLDALKRDPMGAVERVYEQLGTPLTAEARAAMERWLAQRTVRHGAHAFALRDFGLSEEGVMADPVFRRYCETYMGAPSCE